MCCRRNISNCEHCSEINTVTKHKLAGGRPSTCINDVCSNHKIVVLNEQIKPSLDHCVPCPTGRADLEKQARKAQELWLACQALMTSLVEGQSGMTDEEKMKPLHNEVTAVAWAGNDHPFVNTITDTLPATALERGVQTEESLVTRFEKVRRMCRRVALIDERGGSLFKYFLSYAQSLFVFTMAKPLTDSDQIDPEDLNTFRLVDNAQYCLARGDLEQALRYMNQLRGMPRAIASDWIAEVRLYLEAKQATNALLAHASASGLGSLF